MGSTVRKRSLLQRRALSARHWGAGQLRLRIAGRAWQSDEAETGVTADRSDVPMVKRIMIAVVAFYLLGVFGVTGGYLAEYWENDWGTGDQVLTALQNGALWPKLVVEAATGS